VNSAALPVNAVEALCAADSRGARVPLRRVFAFAARTKALRVRHRLQLTGAAGTCGDLAALAAAP